MADTPQAPTQDQVDAAQKAAVAKWEGDFKEEDLEVPYKREEAAKTDEEKAVEEPEEGKDTEEKAEPLEQVTQAESLITAQDPGEYKAADYSFEVTDKNGKTIKISTPEEAEAFAEDDENFQTARDLKNFLSKSGKMETKLERDYEKWEKDHKTYEDQVALQKQRDEAVQTLANGLEYLITKGLMPAISPADATADWSNPEVAKHEGVKEQIALINYMTKENEAREKAGIPLLTSALDAYNAWQMDNGRKTEEQQRKEQEAEDKRQAEARKAAGARVAGTSPAPQAPYVPKGISVGNPNVLRRGASIWDD